jgi:hypothetical protein
MHKIILTALLFYPSVITSYGAAIINANHSFEDQTTGDGT